MPTTGSYEFKLAAAAKDCVIEDAMDLKPGEWGWVDRSADEKRWLMLFACCPDCTHAMTLWRRFGTGKPAGHDIDGAGNIRPSVLHSYPVDGVEQCGFHTMPTKLLGFVDLR